MMKEENRLAMETDEPQRAQRIHKGRKEASDVIQG
jgi:hypothetical protein